MAAEPPGECVPRQHCCRGMACTTAAVALSTCFVYATALPLTVLRLAWPSVGWCCRNALQLVWYRAMNALLLACFFHRTGGKYLLHVHGPPAVVQSALHGTAPVQAFDLLRSVQHPVPMRQRQQLHHGVARLERALRRAACPPALREAVLAVHTPLLHTWLAVHAAVASLLGAWRPAAPVESIKREQEREREQEQAVKLPAQVHTESMPAPSQTLVVANHPSELDPFLMMPALDALGGLPAMLTVLKAELRNVPVLGWGCRMFDYIFLQRRADRDLPAIADAAKFMARLPPAAETWLPFLGEAPASVVLFPEGTVLWPGAVARSRAFAASNGKAQLLTLLQPRFRALQQLLQHNPRITRILDLTLTYTDELLHGQTAETYGEGRSFQRLAWHRGAVPHTVHVDARYLDAAPFREDVEAALQALWVQKDAIIQRRLLGKTPVGVLPRFPCSVDKVATSCQRSATTALVPWLGGTSAPKTVLTKDRRSVETAILEAAAQRMAAQGPWASLIASWQDWSVVLAQQLQQHTAAILHHRLRHGANVHGAVMAQPQPMATTPTAQDGDPQPTSHTVVLQAPTPVTTRAGVLLSAVAGALSMGPAISAPLFVALALALTIAWAQTALCMRRCCRSRAYASRVSWWPLLLVAAVACGVIGCVWTHPTAALNYLGLTLLLFYGPMLLL